MRNLLNFLSIAPLSISLACFPCLTYAVELREFPVIEGECLSTLVHNYIPGPVWGKNGSLKQVLVLNPQIKNPDQLLKGEIIFLPPKQAVVLQPTRMPTSEVEPEKETPVLYSLSPQFSFLNLQTTDLGTQAKASISSQLHTSVTAKIKQNWKSGPQIFERFSIGMMTLEPPHATGHYLNNSTKIISGFGVGVVLNHSAHSQLQFSANYDSEIFTRALSSSVIAIDNQMIPRFSAQYAFNLVEEHPYELGVSLNTGVLFPALVDDYALRLGYQYGASIFLNKAISSESPFGVEMAYLKNTQNTSIAEQTAVQLLLSLHLFIQQARKARVP